MQNSMKTSFIGAEVSTQPVVAGEAIRAQGNTSHSGALDQYPGTVAARSGDATNPSLHLGMPW